MRVRIAVCEIFFVLAAMASFAQKTSGRLLPNASTPLGAGSNTNYGNMLSEFEANQGQVDPQVKFLFRGRGYTAFLTSGSMVLSLRPANVVAIPQTGNPPNSSHVPPSSTTTMQFRLSGAAKNPTVIGEGQQPGRVNYFIGRDPAKWHTNVPTYASVRYRNVYPGIDLVYYGNHQQLEYDFVISAGADPGQIEFEIQGAEGIRIDESGNLVLKTASGDLHFESPIVYQETDGQRVVVDGGYVVNDPTHITFHVAHHDSTKTLVIDPVLVYSTYLGGSGTDQPAGIALDNTGSVYIAGYTDSADFPLAALGSLPIGADHVFVAKFDPTGSNLVYADYIGGSNQDFGYALALDSANNVYVTGSTQSTDFPVVNAYQASAPGSYTGFVTKISADGSSLLYSTYLGGDNYDQPASIAIDGVGEISVAGITSSQNFPVVNAYQPTISPNQVGYYGVYGFVTKFSADGSSLVYSTFLGGNSNVAQTCTQGPCWPAPFSLIYGLALDANDNAYVAGQTNTYNFPATPGAYLTIDSAPLDAMIGFVSKFNSSGALDYSTYLYGTSGAAVQIASIAVDGSGSAYVTGTAPSDGTFPITSTSICDPSVSFGGCSYAFVTKFDPTGSTLMYSTFLGLYNFAFPQAIVLDQNNDAYVLAVSWGTSFSIPNGIEPYTNGADLLVAEIDPAASTELFATYLGGSSDEYPAGIAVDSNGNVYIGGQTLSSDLPVTSTAFQNTLAGTANAFVMKIGPDAAPAVSVSPFSLQYPAQSIGATSQPQTALLRNMGSSPLSISSITTTGDFAETDSCGTSLPAASNCSFSVTFTPTGVGTRSGSILIQDNAMGSPHVINLSGSGSGAVAALSPTSLAFAAQPVGTSSAAQAVTLTNTGNATLNIAGIQMTGDYGQTNTCSAILAPSSSCTISVIFTPTASGTRNGTLTISDDALGSPQSVNLTGTGSIASAPVATVTPANLAFAAQSVGTSSAAQAVTLTNTGSAALNITGVQTTGDYAQSNNCPASLSAGSTCAINVTFTPTASGTRNGTLTMSDNALGSPQSVNLTGTGSVASAPVATVTPANLAFAAQSVGTSSAARAVTLTNTGNATLNITGVQMTGDYAQSNNCPASLSAGSTCAINVTFTPTASGTRNGTLTISDNALGSPQSVNLTGTGSVASAPVATVTPANLAFAAQSVGTSSAARAVTLTNTGNATLNITGVQMTGDYAQSNNCPASLSAGSTCAINVTFTPTQTGTRNGSVAISDSAVGSPQTVGLTGAGSDFSLASSAGSATVKAGATATFTLTVAPAGGTFANAVKLSCSGAPAKTTCSLSSSSVTPGSSSASVTMTINTTAPSADLALPGSAKNQPVFAMWIGFYGLGLFALTLTGSKRRTRKALMLIAVAVLGGSMLFMSACAGGTGIGPSNQSGTTPGTYTITVSGSSGALHHSVPVILTVQ